MKEKIVSHTSHAKLQYYRHNYCLVFMTGLLGCRWHRYQQSTRDSRKRDLLYFCLTAVAFFYMLVFFYFWLVIRNGDYFITVDMYLRMGEYIPWYGLGLGLSSAVFAYLTVIMVLCLLHVFHGHQLYIHPVHIVLTSLTLVTCVVVTVLIHIYWSRLWPLMYISLKVYGPFLQPTAVIIATPLAWLVFRQWFRLTSRVAKSLLMALYVVAMIALYISPIAIDSPLIRRSTPSKPDIIAVGGASDAAPENTMFAFKKALDLGVNRIYTTVQISRDGVPFLFEDRSLSRTTDADTVFAANGSLDPTAYNFDELELLNAGNWFLKDDPWDTVSSLSSEDEESVSYQKIPRLAQLFTLGEINPNLKIYLKVMPMQSGHPFCCQPGRIISDVMKNHPTLNKSNIFMPVSNFRLNSTEGILEHYIAEEDIKRTGATVAYLHINKKLESTIKTYQENNLTVIADDVNSHWFFSFVWCVGTDMVATRYIHHLQSLHEPIWKLNDTSYLSLWLTVDIFSAVIIVILFLVHRIRLYGTNFSPESISLNTGRTKTSYRSRTMKEKLLREGAIIDNMDELEVRDSDAGGLEQPAYTMTITSSQQAYSLSSLPDMSSRTARDLTSGACSTEVGLAPPSTITDRYSV